MTNQHPPALDTFKILEAKIAAGQILLIRRESQTAAQLGAAIPQVTEAELLHALADTGEFKTSRPDPEGKRWYDLTPAGRIRAQKCNEIMTANAARETLSNP